MEFTTGTAAPSMRTDLILGRDNVKTTCLGCSYRNVEGGLPALRSTIWLIERLRLWASPISILTASGILAAMLSLIEALTCEQFKNG
jgi:hypothetical protein